MNRIVSSSVCVLLSITVSTAFCQPPGGRGPDDRGFAGRGPGPSPNAVLAALDVNSDHELSTREILAAAASLKKLDKNGDGKLTRDELHPEMRGGRPGFGPQGGPEGRLGRGADGRGARRPAGLGPEGRGPGGGRGGPGGPPSGEQFVEDALGFDADQNFLFGPPGAGGFDLASLNIQRGRDHGLADFNQIRVDMGMAAVESFADISADPEIQRRLEDPYGDVNSIDAWVGMLAEDHADGSALGITATTIIAEQLARLREGDRFYYENVFSGGELRRIEDTTLLQPFLARSGRRPLLAHNWRPARTLRLISSSRRVLTTTC